MADPLFSMRFDAEDRALLEAVAAADKLSYSDVIRRALRAYARRLGVEVPGAPKAAAPKTRARRPRKGGSRG